MFVEQELTEAVDLCLANGRLNTQAVGWSRQPLHRCNLSGRWLRKKQWNYWAMITETHLFSVTVSNLDYSGVIFVYVADFEDKTVNEVTKIVPLGRGCALPEIVNGDVHFAAGGWSIDMVHSSAGVTIDVNITDFDGVPLRAHFDVELPVDHETLNVVIPWDEKTFQFTSKQNSLPAVGEVQFGKAEIAFKGEQSFACLDLGRGIWPRDCVWNWGSASGKQNGRIIGLNLGGQWTDSTGMTENGICVNGRLTKISEDLQWQYDKSDFMKLWRIVAPSGQIDLTFTPFLERIAASNLWLIQSEVHQMFGHFNGRIQTEEGETIDVQNLVGWAEDHVAKW